jgi:ribosomal protein L11 methyltransferase
VIDRGASRKVRNALDLGTGSGVLAIAARKLKNIPVLATDIDPIATRVAAENVKRNGIAIRHHHRDGARLSLDGFSAHGPFDLIIANILARPLIKMAPQLASHLAPGGSVILSGILASQRWKVLAAYNGAAPAPCPHHLAQRLGDDPSRPSLSGLKF